MVKLNSYTELAQQ